MQRPQGMIEWDHMNQGLTGGVPQPDPTGYPGFQPGMHPMQAQAHYGPHSGMGIPRMISQPTPQPTMYNMAQSGGPMMQRHPHMGGHPAMVRPPMNPSPFMTRGMPPGPMPPMRPIMNMASMQGSGEQVVTALPNPYTTGVDPVHQPPGHPSGAPSPYSGSGSSSVYPSSHQTASSGAPPPQPHPPQTNSPKPRVSLTNYQCMDDPLFLCSLLKHLLLVSLSHLPILLGIPILHQLILVLVHQASQLSHQKQIQLSC